MRDRYFRGRQQDLQIFSPRLISQTSLQQRGITQGDLNGLPSAKQHKRFNLNSLSENITNLLQHNATKCGFHRFQAMK